jgi:hypothetical protein
VDVNHLYGQTEIIFWCWVTFISCVYIAPSVVRNIRALRTGNFSLKDRASRASIPGQLKKRLIPLALVSAGILYLNLEQAYGFKFEASAPTYLFAIGVGVFSLVVGTASAMTTVTLLNRYFPELYKREIDQYQSAMSSLGFSDRRVAIVTAVLNGFAEESIVRVFLMGTLVFLGFPIWLAAVISLALNGIEHFYQGRILGPAGVVVSQIPFAVLFGMSWNFGLVAVAHITADLVGALLVPWALGRFRK